jgi:cell division protease FtsH
MHLPENDRYTKSCSEVMDELVVLMGGRMAEQLIFNDITSGAAMDISQATSLARRMVCEWGMSKRMGPLNYGSRSDHIYLGREITRSEDHSEQTTREIDEEVRAIIDSAASRTRKLLEDNRDKLQLLGDTLLERETLGADDIREILGIRKPASKIDKERPEAEGAEQDEEGVAAPPRSEEADAASQPADEGSGEDAETSGAEPRDDA